MRLLGSGVRDGHWLPAAVYVAVVAGLGAAAASDPEMRRAPLVAAVVLCMPVFVSSIVVFYVVGSTAWNLTGAGDGGAMWPVTVTYAAMFATIAALNALVLRALVGNVRGRLGRSREVVPGGR